MASPFVAGIVALMRDANPSLTPAQVKTSLTQTAIDWGPAAADNAYGAGRVDANAAVDAVSALSGSGPPVPTHLHVADCLTGTGDVDVWSLTVPDTAWPIAATLLMEGDGTSPDIDLYLHDPSDVEVASSTLSEPQEFFGFRPVVPGTYTLRVESFENGGSYSLDMSGPTGVTGGADGCP